MLRTIGDCSKAKNALGDFLKGYMSLPHNLCPRSASDQKLHERFWFRISFCQFGVILGPIMADVVRVFVLLVFIGWAMYLANSREYPFPQFRIGESGDK